MLKNKGVYAANSQGLLCAPGHCAVFWEKWTPLTISHRANRERDNRTDFAACLPLAETGGLSVSLSDFPAVCGCRGDGRSSLPQGFLG